MAGEQVEKEFVKQLSNFVKAIIAIAPSRNYVTQFLFLIRVNEGRLDYKVLEEAYPDIMKDSDVRDAFAKIFGISFSEKVSLKANGYGWHLTDFIMKAFELFESSEFRAKVSSMLKEEFPEEVPNLAREWVEVSLEGLSSEPTYGKDSIKILKEIVKIGRLKVEELEKRLNLDRGTILQCLDLLSIYNLIKRDYDGSYRASDLLSKYSDLLGGF
ncbi:MAG: hypothetical protein QXX87_02705 [Candidatus Jordarchaeales archaeon]